MQADAALPSPRLIIRHASQNPFRAAGSHVYSRLSSEHFRGSGTHEEAEQVPGGGRAAVRRGGIPDGHRDEGLDDLLPHARRAVAEAHRRPRLRGGGGGARGRAGGAGLRALRPEDAGPALHPGGHRDREEPLPRALPGPPPRHLPRGARRGGGGALPRRPHPGGDQRAHQVRLSLRGRRVGLQGQAIVTQIGEVALWLALLVAGWGAVLGFYGGRRGRGDLVLSAERSMFAVFGLLLTTALAIITAFVRSEFRYKYVAGYSNRELGLF